jgi:ABC-type siderophore export system fused ATPase/permease subunit
VKEIPANLSYDGVAAPTELKLEGIRAQGIRFAYPSVDDQVSFEIGPIDLEVGRGEILFIVGGNGSGKSTLAKLIAGLYSPSEGTFFLNEIPVDNYCLSEHVSAVFSPAYLFHKLYNIDANAKKAVAQKYLSILGLEEKVKISGNRYNTIDLSGGQRKRLALLQCYLEDSPIYLFDEWAADQDPGYRNFFYRTLLPDMKRQGKIVIAITHDDNYFDVADKVIKMESGRSELYSGDRNLFGSSVIFAK